MDFAYTARAVDYQEQLTSFMRECIYPAEERYHAEMHAAGDPHAYPDVLHELKAEARKRGLWNLFLPDPDHGPGLSNVDYAPLAELSGRSPHLAPEALNCNAPDSGNMEILAMFGTQEQKEQWLLPLLAGDIASGFAMTEPGIASSDATNIELSMVADGDDYVLNGRKWWTSNAMHPLCRVLIVMGKTDTSESRHRQQSMILVPMDTPGLRIVRSLPVFGYLDREGHAEIEFNDVRVPRSALLVGPGEGFAISQARLGPGRIHHCMRAIGIAERALDLMIDRAEDRRTFGEALSSRSNIQDWIAEARIDIEMVRLLTLKAAWIMDHHGNKAAQTEIAAIKVAAPRVALRVLDRSIQVHGGAGVSDDLPLAGMFTYMRSLRIADGPDEVHKRAIARFEMRRRSHERQHA